MLVVIPVCSHDAELALKNLAVCRKLDGKTSHPALISHPRDFDASKVVAAAKEYFPSVTERHYDEIFKCGWPKAANWAFQEAVRYIENINPPTHWLWWEMDATPLMPKWLDILDAAYTEGGKLFAGALTVQGPLAYMAGVGIYPGKPTKHLINAMRTRVQPFDIVAGTEDGATKNTYDISGIIVHRIVPESFPDLHTAQTRIPNGAVLFHKCKDGSLADVILSANNDVNFAGDGDLLGSIFPFDTKVASVLGNTNTFYHSGNLGDIVYALTGLKYLGACNLMIGPTQKETSPAGNPVSLPQYRRLAPLLDHQPYVLSHSFSSRYPGIPIFDLNTFRNAWNDRSIRDTTGINLLAQMHCHVLGIGERFSVDDTWLNVPNPIKTGLFACHRSPRYRDDTFPWHTVLEHFKGRLLFVGLPEEHAEFQRMFNVRVAYWQPKDFLELASVIAGSNGFIGNQSFPCSLAIGYGQRVLQEAWHLSKDCAFTRSNFLSQYHPGTSLDSAALSAWEKSTLVTSCSNSRSLLSASTRFVPYLRSLLSAKP